MGDPIEIIDGVYGIDFRSRVWAYVWRDGDTLTLIDTGEIPDAAPARVDRELRDGDLVGSATVIHLPGHTPGSIALYVPSRRAIFLGDAAAGTNTGKPMVGAFNVDPRQAMSSLERLNGLEIEIACFGHGRPVMTPLGRSFGDLLRSL